jgi:hypothetical protein
MTDERNDGDQESGVLPGGGRGAGASTNGGDYQLGSGGSQSEGSPGSQTDGHGEGNDRSVSPGYQSDSEGRRSRDETQGLSDQGHAEDEAPEELDLGMIMARAESRRRRDQERRAPGTWMPGSEDLDRDPRPGDGTGFAVDGPKREYASHQLGVRLRPEQFDRVREAARLYGVRPTTLARMMIIRGTKAIEEAENRARARELLENADD